MKYQPTTQLASRLAELAQDLASGRIDADDHDQMRRVIVAELMRRQMKASR